MKLSKCEWCVLRMTGCKSPGELTEKSPLVTLKRDVIRMSIWRCSRVRHSRSSSLLVALHVLLYRRRRHWAARPVSFRSYINRYFQRLGGGPYNLSRTRPGGGLSLCKTKLIKALVRVLATTGIRLRSQALSVYKYTKIHGPQFERNYIIAKDQKRVNVARHFRHGRK